MKLYRIITFITLSFLTCFSNLNGQYDNGKIIYSETNSTNLTSILKNYIIVDFDGDNYVDIVMVKNNASNDTNQLTWYKGNGSENFSQQANLLSVENDHKENEIFYEDMNGDGIEDIVFQNDTMGFKVLLSDGLGNISSQINNVAATGDLIGADLKEIADVDGDGDMDGIFFAKTDYYDFFFHFPGIPFYGHCMVGYNNGSGAFTNYSYLDNDNPEVFLLIETGDIDGDGDLDIVSSGNSGIARAGGFGPFYYTDAFVRVYKNLGNNGFATKQEISVPVINNEEPTFTHINIQDIDDNDNDELMIEYAILDDCLDNLHLHYCDYFYQFHVLDYSSQTGAFINIETYNTWLHGYPLEDFYLSNDELYDEAFLIQFDHQNTDINLDILSVNVPQGRLQWYLGDGNGSFNNTQFVNFNGQYSSIRPALRVADIDNDTDLDIFVLLNDDTSSTLTVFKNFALTPTCVSVLDLGNTSLIDGIYQAGTTTISSGNVVSGNNNVVLKAGNRVKLQSGFKAPANSSLKVRIGSCN